MKRLNRKASAGFTYLGVLLLVAFMGAMLGAVGEVWRTAQLREAERDLRFVGKEFRHAIQRYYESTPGAVKNYPRDLKDMVQDNRYPGTRRYLRRIYRDPITLRDEWGLVRAPDGGIAGVYSLSEDEALGTFDPSEPLPATPPAEQDKAGKKVRYADWIFAYTPPSPPGQPASPPPGGPSPPPGESR